MAKKIAIVGAGGFGQEVFCIWKDMLCQRNEEFDFIGFFDDNLTKKVSVFGNILGNINSINSFKDNLELVIAIGNTNHLEEVSKKIINPYINFPNVIHPSVQFYDLQKINIGSGNIISPFALISANVNIGNFNILNTRVTIAHDVSIGHYNVLSPNTQINGNVKINDKVFFGFNSGIMQNKTVESGVTVGAGAIMLRDAKELGTYFGNPATKLKINF